jgi:hypothetical protein
MNETTDAPRISAVGFLRTLDLLATYAARADDLSGWLADSEINRERSLRLMYLAGLGLNNYTASSIYSELLEFRSFPEDLFSGAPGRVGLLRQLMDFR